VPCPLWPPAREKRPLLCRPLKFFQFVKKRKVPLQKNLMVPGSKSLHGAPSMAFSCTFPWFPDMELGFYSPVMVGQSSGVPGGLWPGVPPWPG